MSHGRNCECEMCTVLRIAPDAPAPAPRPSGEPPPLNELRVHWCGERDNETGSTCGLLRDHDGHHVGVDPETGYDYSWASAPAPTATPDEIPPGYVPADWDDGSAMSGTAPEGGRDALAKEMCSLCSYAYVRDFDNLPDDDREEWLRLADYVLARESGLQAHVSALREQRDRALADVKRLETIEAVRVEQVAELRESGVKDDRVAHWKVRAETPDPVERGSLANALGYTKNAQDRLAAAFERENAANERAEKAEAQRDAAIDDRNDAIKLAEEAQVRERQAVAKMANIRSEREPWIAEHNETVDALAAAREEAARLREAQKLHEKVDRSHSEHYSALSTSWRIQTEQLKELRRLAQRLCDEAGKATASDDPLRIVEAVAWMDLRAFLVPHTVTIVDTP